MKTTEFIDLLEGVKYGGASGKAREVYSDKRYFLDRLRALPSMDVTAKRKRKHGKWLNYTDYFPSAYGEDPDVDQYWNFECSCCEGHVFEDASEYEYCPFCGAKMEMEE